MRNYLSILIIMVLLSISVVSQTKNNSKGEKELLKMEDALSEALVRYDIKALDQIWSDDFIFTGTGGKITTKAQRLSGVKIAAESKETVVGGSTNDEVKVRIFKDTAVVTILSTWKGKDGTKEFSSQYQATHVWVKQNRRWQLVAAQVSEVKR